MPLLDHFRPPVSDEIQWNTFHSAWASALADRLNQVVPDEYRVHEHLKLGGGVEIDVAAIRAAGLPAPPPEPRKSEWQPSHPVATAPAVFPDRFEVLVYRQFGGRQLVAAIELVSPGNKDAPDTRQAFAAKVASYLHEGVCVLVVDVVTERRANLHDDVIRLLGLPAEWRMPPDPPHYAVVYRPVVRDDRPEYDLWVSQFDVGDPLPTMPLRLIADYFIPVELEATYTDTRRRRRLV